MTALDLRPWRTTCAECGQPVVSATLPTRLRVALGVEPDEVHGRYVVSTHNGQLFAGMLHRNQAAGARDQGIPLYSNHFTNCQRRARRR